MKHDTKRLEMDAVVSLASVFAPFADSLPL